MLTQPEQFVKMKNYYHFKHKGIVVVTENDSATIQQILDNAVESDEIEPHELEDMLNQGMLTCEQEGSISRKSPAIYRDEAPGPDELMRRILDKAPQIEAYTTTIPANIQRTKNPDLYDRETRELEHQTWALKALTGTLKTYYRAAKDHAQQQHIKTHDSAYAALMEQYTNGYNAVVPYDRLIDRAEAVVKNVQRRKVIAEYMQIDGLIQAAQAANRWAPVDAGLIQRRAALDAQERALRPDAPRQVVYHYSSGNHRRGKGQGVAA